MGGNTKFVELDGSISRSGGQILRTALSLSLITGKPFRLRNARTPGSKAGLGLQHLAAVGTCAAIGSAAVSGANVGSTSLEFVPQGLVTGNFRFDIGTAGATTLLLQTLLWPLALQSKPSTLTLLGGTHVPGAPTFEYLSLCWAPTIRRLGIGFDLRMPKAGFYPKGGGELRVSIRGGSQPHGVLWRNPVVFDAFTGASMQAGFTEEVAERQAAGAREVLEAASIYCPMKTAALEAPNPGTAMALVAVSKHTPVCITVLGAKGKTPEDVGREAAEALVQLVRARAPVDPYAADQLLLPLALAREPSAFLTAWPTEHLRTQAQVIGKFLPVSIAIEPEPQGRARVFVEPRDVND